jgi:hypothetical protein
VGEVDPYEDKNEASEIMGGGDPQGTDQEDTDTNKPQAAYAATKAMGDADFKVFHSFLFHSLVTYSFYTGSWTPLTGRPYCGHPPHI